MTAAVPASPIAAAKAPAGSHAGASKGATPAAPATGDAFAALMDALAAFEAPTVGDAAPGPATSADAATTAEDATAADAGPAQAAPGIAAATPLPLPSDLPAAMLAIANAPVKGEGARHAMGTDATASAGTDSIGTADAPGRSGGARGAARTQATMPGAAATADTAADDVAPKPHAVAAEAGTATMVSAAARFEAQPTASARATHELAPAFALHGHAPTMPDPVAAPNAPVHQAALPSHPLDAAFAGDMAAEVRVMAQAGVQRAELHLNPADLGPVRIELSLTAQTADIQFTAAHATTREGIEQALPQLRDLLAASGLQLGQAGVGSGGQGMADGSAWREQAREAQAQGRGPSAARPGAAGVDGVLGTSTHAASVRRGRGMLDLYA